MECVCIYVCVRVWMCNVCMYAHFSWVWLCIYVRAYVTVFIFMYIYVHVCLRICVYVLRLVNMCSFKCFSLCVHIHILGVCLSVCQPLRMCWCTCRKSVIIEALRLSFLSHWLFSFCPSSFLCLHFFFIGFSVCVIGSSSVAIFCHAFFFALSTFSYLINTAPCIFTFL